MESESESESFGTVESERCGVRCKLVKKKYLRIWGWYDGAGTVKERKIRHVDIPVADLGLEAMAHFDKLWDKKVGCWLPRKKKKQKRIKTWVSKKAVKRR